MQPAEKKKNPCVAESRIFLEKEFAQSGVNRIRRLDAKRRDSFPATIEPERFPRLDQLLLGSENDCARIAQHTVIRPRPVKPFFQMLEGIGSPEPRIEHAMRKNIIWDRGAGVTPPRGEAVILPEAVDDHAVEAPAFR